MWRAGIGSTTDIDSEGIVPDGSTLPRGMALLASSFYSCGFGSLFYAGSLTLSSFRCCGLSYCGVACDYSSCVSIVSWITDYSVLDNDYLASLSFLNLSSKSLSEGRIGLDFFLTSINGVLNWTIFFALGFILFKRRSTEWRPVMVVTIGWRIKRLSFTGTLEVRTPISPSTTPTYFTDMYFSAWVSVGRESLTCYRFFFSMKTCGDFILASSCI